MKRLSPVVLLVCLLASESAFAQTNTLAPHRETFENLLSSFCSAVACGERPSPFTEQGAREIVSDSLNLTVANADYALKVFNEPLLGMNVGAMFVPEKDLTASICKYYGFTLSEYDRLEEAAQNARVAPGFYVARVNEPKKVNFKVNDVIVLKNGLTVVTGMEGEDAAPFRAYFKKSGCGGKPHWVLLKFINLKIPEESDDFPIPQDK